MRTLSLCLAPKAAFLIMAAGLSTAGVDARAGEIIGPGGNVRIWTEAVSDDWHTAGNWTGNTVPQVNDAAQVLNGNANVFLNGSVADLASLFISFNRVLSTNGHKLRVTNAAGSTTVTGVDSQIYVPDSGPPGWELQTVQLSLENEGRLGLAGGDVLVTDQLTATGDGRVSGHGLLRVQSGSAAALNLFDAAPLNASGGSLLIQVFGGGSFAPPQLIQAQPGSVLNIDAPLWLPVRDLTIGDDSFVSFEEDWTAEGQITAQPGAGNTAWINPGGGVFTLDGTLNAASGEFRVLTETNLEDGSEVSVTGGLGTSATLRFEDTVHAFPGHTTTLGLGARLRMDGQIPFQWHGNLVSNAGVIENNESSGQWDIHGDITFGSLFALRSRLEGTSTTRFFGFVSLPGLGVIVDAPIDLMSSADVNIAGENTQLILNSTAVIYPFTDVFGDGTFVINPDGTLFAAATSDINVDVTNSGELNAGSEQLQEAYVYIDGDYTQTFTGRLVVDLGGNTPLEHDVYETSGSATLTGELSVNLINGFEPEIGDTFDIFAANAGVIGTFDELTGAAGFEVSYSSPFVTLEYVGDVLACPGDVTEDGQVNLADLNLVLANFGQATSDGDTNGDGLVDLADLNAVLAAFGTSCL